MNYFDRYLSQWPMPRDSLHALAAACLLVASKIGEPAPLRISEALTLCGAPYCTRDLVALELDILKTLEWACTPVTPHCFSDHLIALAQPLRSAEIRALARIAIDGTIAGPCAVWLCIASSHPPHSSLRRPPDPLFVCVDAATVAVAAMSAAIELAGGDQGAWRSAYGALPQDLAEVRI